MFKIAKIDESVPKTEETEQVDEADGVRYT